MALPTLAFLVNKTVNDVPCSNEGGDTNFLLFGSGDKLVWRDSQQVDQDLVSGPKYPVIKPTTDYIEAPKTFIMDSSEGKYIQIPLAGTVSGGQSGGNTRYPFALHVGGPTAGIPYLEAWDSNAHSSAIGAFLGSGNATNSTLKAISTTNGSPGSTTWFGTPLAGVGSRVALDGDALSEAKFLYWNMWMYVPHSLVVGQSSAYVLAVRILYS